MYKRLLYGIVAMTALFHSIGADAQGKHKWLTADSALYKKAVNCKMDNAYILAHGVDTSITSGTGSPLAIIIPTSFPASAIDTCGKFQIFYEDKSLATTEGFDDPSYGNNRRAVLCEVLGYIQNTYDFNSVPSGKYIRLQVSRSYTSGYHAPSGTAFSSLGSPYFRTGTGVSNGFVAEFAQTGTDPLLGHYHAQLQVNFDSMYITTYTGGATAAIDYFQTPSSTAINNCQIDLNTSLLHSMTHCLGWYSFIASTVPPLGIGSGLFTSIDTAAAITPDATTSTAPFGSIAKIVTSGTITHSGVGDWWMNSLNPPYNHPISVDRSTTLSHLSDGFGSYAYYQRISPGDWQEYVMTPYAINGKMRRAYTKGELETIKRTIGYNYTSSYASAHSATIANHVPYSSKMFSDTFNHLYMVTSFNASHERMQADYTMTNDSGATITIDLALDTSIHDADGNTISVAAGTLINLRGCGVGGNNHNSLTLSAGNTRITYTPRHNFYGKAQLAFNLYDGIEKGAYVVYTIDVKKGNNVSVPFGQNLVLNGDFEEGTEVKTKGSGETIPNTVIDDNSLHEGRFSILHLGDSHPYDCFMQTSRLGGAVSVKNSYASCTDATTLKNGFGTLSSSFPIPLTYGGGIGGYYKFRMSDASMLGERFARSEPTSFPSYYYLGKNLEKCHRYVIEFDVYRQFFYSDSLGYTGTRVKDSLRATIGFSNDRAVNFAAFDWFDFPTWESPTLFHKLTPLPKYVLDTFSWQHIKIPFDYCSDSSANILFFNPAFYSEGLGGLAFDNLSIVEDSTFMKVKIRDSITTACNGHRLLADTSHVIFYRCDTAGAPLRYTWYKGSVIVGTSPFIDVTSDPTSTTYRVVVNEGCRSATDSFVLAPLVGPIVTIHDTSICSGTSALLNVTVTGTKGTVTYNWTPSTGLSCTSCATPIASPTTTTTYTLTVTDSLGCNTQPLTVTVNPTPAISVSPTSVSMCNGDSATLTASGGTSYIWSPSTGVSCSTCNPVKVSPPTSPYIYTVTGTNSYGCSGTAADTIKVGLCACRPIDVFGTTATTMATGTVPVSVSAGKYYIPANLTISSNTTMTGAIILIAPNVTITVANNVKLTLDACHLFTCPDSNYMWNGIVLESGATSARIEVKNNSLIEDAKIAIKAFNPKIPASGDIIRSVHSIYNRNQLDIYVQGLNVPTPAVYPFTIKSNVFTARQFNKTTMTGYPNTWASTTTLKTKMTPIDATPSYVLNRNYPRAMAKDSVMKYMGITFENVGNTVGAGTSFSEVVIGSNTIEDSANLFDNHKYGIYSNKSNMTVYNNTFINMSKRYTPSTLPASVLPDWGGLGIFARSGLARYDRMRIIALSANVTNKFHDCFDAMGMDSMAEFTVSNAEVTTSHQIGTTAVGAAYPSEIYSGSGIWIAGYGNHNKWSVNSNTFSNVCVGIVANINNPKAGATTNFDNNKFHNANKAVLYAPLYAGFKSKQYINRPIQVSMSGVGTYSTFTANGNVMENTFNGILLSGLRTAKPTVNTNQITLWDTLIAGQTDYGQCGIRMEHCITGTISNNVISTPTLNPNVSLGDRIKGVVSNFNTDLKVCSNTTTNIGRGFEFGGKTGQVGTRWIGNTMTNSYKGFVLGSNIDDQGFMYNDLTLIPRTFYGAIGNKWNGAWSTASSKYQTVTIDSIHPSLSKLYVNTSSALELPTVNTVLPTPMPASYIYSNPATLRTPTSQWAANCIGALLPTKTTSIPKGGVGKSFAVLLMSDSLGYGMGYRPNQWMGQLSLYQMGVFDTEYRDSIPELNDFMIAAESSRYKWITDIEMAFAQDSLNEVQALLDNPTAGRGYEFIDSNIAISDYAEADYVVQNYADYYSIYLHYLQAAMTGTDSTTLNTLAYKCPAKDGAVVYQARDLQQQISKVVTAYNDEGCLYGNGGQYRLAPNAELTGEQQYTLYPNPNNGTFVVKQSVADNKVVNLKVYNAIGLLVHQSEVAFVNGQIQIDLKQKARGVYLVCIGNNTERTTCLRFVIN